MILVEAYMIIKVSIVDQLGVIDQLLVLIDCKYDGADLILK